MYTQVYMVGFFLKKYTFKLKTLNILFSKMFSISKYCLLTWLLAITRSLKPIYILLSWLNSIGFNRTKLA